MTWTDAELNILDRAGEIRIAPRRPDGTLRPATTIWGVRVDGEVYVRSFAGTDGGWYRRATATGNAHIHTGDIDRDVTVEAAPDATGVDDAYRAKYGRSAYLDPMISASATASTLLLRPVG